MSTLKEKIAAQSKVILTLAKVARIILYVMLGLITVAICCTFFDFSGPVFYLFGQPVYQLELLDGMTPAAARSQYITAIIQIILAETLLKMTSDLFAFIKNAQSPFGAGVIKKMKTVGVLLGLVIAVDNGYLGVVIGFVIYAFAMIFEYGGELQEQVDETL